jgi:uncharacterized protein YpuA (DUF1002 family)
MLENIEVDKNTLAVTSYLSVLANLLESFNSSILDPDITLDEKSKILIQIDEAFTMYYNFKTTIIEHDQSTILEFKTQLESFMEDYNYFLTTTDIQTIINYKNDIRNVSDNLDKLAIDINSTYSKLYIDSLHDDKDLESFINFN